MLSEDEAEKKPLRKNRSSLAASTLGSQDHLTSGGPQPITEEVQ